MAVSCFDSNGLVNISNGCFHDFKFLIRCRLRLNRSVTKTDRRRQQQRELSQVSGFHDFLPRRLAQLSQLAEKSEHNQGRLLKSLHYRAEIWVRQSFLRVKMRGDLVYSRKQ